MKKYKTELERQAYQIGIYEADKHQSIWPAAKSEKMMAFIGEHSTEVGASIPWLKAYNAGVAHAIHIQTLEML